MKQCGKHRTTIMEMLTNDVKKRLRRNNGNSRENASGIIDCNNNGDFQMRIEFYIKTTGEPVRYQDEYVIDGLNDIYELYFTGNGEYELKRPLADIGIRFIPSAEEN